MEHRSLARAAAVRVRMGQQVLDLLLEDQKTNKKRMLVISDDYACDTEWRKP
jgi:hypothetical protein